MTKQERILDAAETLTPGKFMLWVNEEGFSCVIENYEDVFDLNRDHAILSIDGIRVEFEDGKLKR